jgi:hypothetical protein
MDSAERCRAQLAECRRLLPLAVSCRQNMRRSTNPLVAFAAIIPQVYRTRHNWHPDKPGAIPPLREPYPSLDEANP